MESREYVGCPHHRSFCCHIRIQWFKSQRSRPTLLFALNPQSFIELAVLIWSIKIRQLPIINRQLERCPQVGGIDKSYAKFDFRNNILICYMYWRMLRVHLGIISNGCLPSTWHKFPISKTVAKVTWMKTWFHFPGTSL